MIDDIVWASAFEAEVYLICFRFYSLAEARAYLEGLS